MILNYNELLGKEKECIKSELISRKNARRSLVAKTNLKKIIY